MADPTPQIDPRTTDQIEAQIQAALAQYLPEFRRQPNQPDQPKPLSGNYRALVKIFARFSEIILQRLNQVPDKNFLAFLDLLGASRLPPQPATVPLTFTLAAGSAVDAIVPSGTQVAAPPALGETEPVLFETERELVVTAAELAQIWVRDPQRDRAANLSQLTQAEADPLALLAGQVDIEHIFYIGENIFLGYPDLQALTLKFDLQPLQIPAGQAIDRRSLTWEIWDGDQGIHIFSPDEEITRATRAKPRIVTDFTKNPANNSGSLTQSGAIVFGNLPLISPQPVAQITSRWIRCRLKTRITQASMAQADLVRVSQLPTINQVTFQATVGKIGQAIAVAFTNQFLIDLSKPFYPFGEKPKFGDILYLGSRAAFAKEGADVTLRLDLADLDALGLALPKAIQKTTVTLIWEIWTANGWFLLGTSTEAGPIAPYAPPTVKFQDLTKAFTEVGADKFVKFKLPQDPDPEPQLTTINGVENFWVRVRITIGNYGKEGSYVEVTKDANNPSGFQFTSPTFRPPLITTLKVDYNLVTSDRSPDYIVTYNDFTYRKIAANTGFKPFSPIADFLPTLHLGFGLPANRAEFPNRALSLYFKLVEPIYQPNGANGGGATTSPPPQLVWQYWSSRTNNWQPLQPQDDTQGLTRPGLVEFLAPPDFAATPDFNLSQPYYWLRIRWQLAPSQPIPESPRCDRVLLNTVLATQTITLRDEILGSSNGNADQRFYPTKTPVLAAPQLAVREGEAPSAADRQVLAQEEGDDAIAITHDATGQPPEIWVRWHEVPDFYGSGPRDRHYVLDHLTGEIRFGDGINGKIPPIGIGNIRLTAYRTGGGSRGNCPAGHIVQLKTTIPYIDSVTNPEAATGGAEAETIAALRDRAPQTVRHGDRAVTLEDYEDLARLASPEVARARCWPLLNLRQEPNAGQTAVGQTPRAIGALSVMIVPRSSAPQPIPSLSLIHQVQDFLAAHSIPTATVAVVGPLYVGVNVTTVITPTTLEGLGPIEQAILQTLTSFLHPLTGGPDGTGWAFGREPTRSDFYALLESVSGVDYVRFLDLNIVPAPDQPPRSTKRFLVYSGIHKITFAQS